MASLSPECISSLHCWCGAPVTRGQRARTDSALPRAVLRTHYHSHNKTRRALHRGRVFPTYRWLDFSGINSVIHWCTVHNQQEKAQEKGTATHKFKEVQASTQATLGHNLFTDEGQERQQLRMETIWPQWVRWPMTSKTYTQAVPINPDTWEAEEGGSRVPGQPLPTLWDIPLLKQNSTHYLFAKIFIK